MPPWVGLNLMTVDPQEVHLDANAEQRPVPPVEAQGLVFNEVQLILAEKRTALSALRTGIAVFVLPLSVLSVLVATSGYYEIPQVMHFLVPLLVVCMLLILLGFYLIIHSILRIRRHDRLVRMIKQKHSAIAEFMD